MTEKLYNLGRVTTGQPMQTAVTAERLNRTAKNFEAIGRVIGTVAEGFVQALVVKPGDVFDDGQLERSQ